MASSPDSKPLWAIVETRYERPHNIRVGYHDAAIAEQHMDELIELIRVNNEAVANLAAHPSSIYYQHPKTSPEGLQLVEIPPLS